MKPFSYLLILSLLLFSNWVKAHDKIPLDFMGNFYDQSGNDYWACDVQPGFMIYDCQFFDYKRIESDENTLSLWLINDGSTKQITIVKKDSLNFDLIDANKTIHCSKKADSIKRIAQDNSFSMDTGTVVIRGHIKNAGKYLKTDSNMEFVFCNEAIRDTRSEFATIDSLGRFNISIKLSHAASCLIKYRNYLKEIFVSPGDQLLFSADADNFNELDFMGTHADVCYDIIKMNKVYEEIENGRQRNSSYAKSPVEFKSYRDIAISQKRLIKWK